jgi:hypothetical protein
VRRSDACSAFWKISEVSVLARTSSAWISAARTAAIPGPSAAKSPSADRNTVVVSSPSLVTRSSTR